MNDDGFKTLPVKTALPSGYCCKVYANTNKNTTTLLSK